MLGRGFAVLRGIDSAGLLKLLEAFFQSRNLSGPTSGDIEDGLISRGLTLLGEMADHGPLIPLDRARIGLILFQEQGKERRFAGAIGADQSDALAVIDLHIGLLKESATADGFFEFFDREHGIR